MIVKQLVETILTVFPQLDRKIILLDIDSSQKKFGLESKLLRTTGTLADISTNTAWVLPSDFLELEDVLCYNSSNEPLYLSNYNLTYEIDLNKFFIYSLTATSITGIPTAISTIRLLYIKKPSSISVDADSFSIDEEFIEGIEADIYSKYFAKYPTDVLDRNGNVAKIFNLQAASFWSKKYYDVLRLAKIKINNKNSREAKEGKYYSIVGKYELPKRIDDNASSTTIIGSINNSYTKYLKIRVTTPSTVTELLTPIGYTITSYAYSTGTILVITAATGTFSLTDTVIISSDPDFTRILASNQITLEWSTNGTRTVEIYE